jgi:hypothetical protein
MVELAGEGQCALSPNLRWGPAAQVVSRSPRRNEAVAERIQTAAERGDFKRPFQPPINFMFSASRSLLMLDAIDADS